jgi:hypothetical protein
MVRLVLYFWAFQSLGIGQEVYEEEWDFTLWAKKMGILGYCGLAGVWTVSGIGGGETNSVRAS